jgi:hypothetical protein
LHTHEQEEDEAFEDWYSGWMLAQEKRAERAARSGGSL